MQSEEDTGQRHVSTCRTELLDTGTCHFQHVCDHVLEEHGPAGPAGADTLSKLVLTSAGS